MGSRAHVEGFTLIELSIVLVIIGLIVGGVLVGQDLVRAAGVRATISQLEKYQAAVNTFRGKFNALPGDMNAATAAQFGFAARGQYAGEGDGNGVIEGVWGDQAGANASAYQVMGETAMFWVDLSKVGFIEGNFSLASSTYCNAPCNITSMASTLLNKFLPEAKVGRGNFIEVWGHGGGAQWWCPGWCNIGNSLSIVEMTSTAGGGRANVQEGLTVSEAYSIDLKIDDGLPLGGRLKALFVSQFNTYGAGGGCIGGCGSVPATSTSCYDNGNSSGNVTVYSIAKNGGAGVNCALSLLLQ